MSTGQECQRDLPHTGVCLPEDEPRPYVPLACNACEARRRLIAAGKNIHFRTCPHCGRTWYPVHSDQESR